jgi:Ser/Thr protein kinase RdoA (MazF antagonist)
MVNKPLQSLTVRGQVRRLRQLADHALEQYDLDFTSFHLLGWYTNLLFRVRTNQGTSYVLRICYPGWRTETDICSEAMWLQAISQETDIVAPRPIPARNGEFVLEAPLSGIPEYGRCVLMTWIPGTPMGKHLTEANLYKMGVLFARLHEYSLRFTPPPGFTQRKMIQPLARDEENVLFQPGCLAGLSSHEQDTLVRTKDRVDKAFRQLYAQPDGLRVIHNDLWHGNIKVYRGHLYPVDFEDTLWGYPIQDIAMAMQDLMSDVTPEAYEPLLAAFRRGYECLLPWPETYEGQMDTFRAGRILWVANYMARSHSQYLNQHITWLTPQLERFLETGLIRKLVKVMA